MRLLARAKEAPRLTGYLIYLKSKKFAIPFLDDTAVFNWFSWVSTFSNAEAELKSSYAIDKDSGSAKHTTPNIRCIVTTSISRCLLGLYADASLLKAFRG